jgi:thiaminase/transcriptional activator TenA
MVGAFAGINPDAFEAALHGMAVMGVCGELAVAKSPVPGTLLTHFVDALYTITPEELASRVNSVHEELPRWSESAFEAVADIMHSIEQYEFIQKMLDGTLLQEQFVRYLQQDKIYLKEYSRDLYAVADMMVDKAEGDFFRATAEEGMESENAMQAMLSERFGIHGETLPVATTLRYTRFLRHYTDTLDVPVVLAAVLPCYWVYNEVGKYLVAQQITPDNPYKEWIQTYGSPEMDEATNYVVGLIDRLAENCTPEKQALMRRVFAEGCALELEFFMIGRQSS